VTTDRDNARFIDNLVVAFAIHCDQHALTREEGVELGQALGEAFVGAAEDRPVVGRGDSASSPRRAP
jgi:hypothetical protein